jgi:hypothetical protein
MLCSVPNYNEQRPISCKQNLTNPISTHGSVTNGVYTITDRRCMESASSGAFSANFGYFWLITPRPNKISKKFQHETTIKDQYETKLVQFLSLTTIDLRTRRRSQD